jgi:hypothetical protein
MVALSSDESRILLDMRASEKMLKNLLRSYILIASGYTYDLRPQRGGEEGKMLLFGYSIGGSGIILKDLYIEHFRGIRTYLEAIAKLNTLNFSKAIVRANIIEEMITGVPEYSGREDLYATVHDAARRMLRYINKNEILESGKTMEEHELPENICVGSNLEICEGVMVVALAIVAMSSPISRVSLGIRQLASHELLRYALDLYSKNIQNKDSILKMISHLLSIITVDTYIWLPYHFSKLLLTYGAELTFSVASTPLDDIVKEITRKRSNPRDILCSLENYSHRFSRDIYEMLSRLISSQRDLLASIGEFANSYRERILRSLGVATGSETIFGRLPQIIQIIRDSKVGGSKDSGSATDADSIYIVTMTEQTGPLFLRMLVQGGGSGSSYMWPRKLILIYTPQTYINYIYTLHTLLSNTIEGGAGRVEILERPENFKDRLCRSRENEYVVYPVIIPSTEGEIVRLIAKGIRNKIEECIKDNRSTQVIGLLQSVSMVSVPFYIELNKLRKLVEDGNIRLTLI